MTTSDDTYCGGVWYTVLASPTLVEEQETLALEDAVALVALVGGL